MSSVSYRLAKRGLDVVVAAGALAVTSPLFAAVAVAVKRDDGGPVFFRQARAGLGGEPFVMLKFRTMSVSGEFASDVDTSSWGSGVPDDFVFKTAASASARVTLVGRFLRRTSLDQRPSSLTCCAGTWAWSGLGPRLWASSATTTPSRRAASSSGPV